MIKNTDNKNLKSLNKAINEENEDVTEYGEFITSYFAWVGLEKQKEIVEKMQKMTDKENTQM